MKKTLLNLISVQLCVNMAKVWQAYLNFMDTRPLLGKSLTAASLMALGDFLAQTVLEPMNSKPEDSKNVGLLISMKKTYSFFLNEN